MVGRGERVWLEALFKARAGEAFLLEVGFETSKSFFSSSVFDDPGIVSRVLNLLSNHYIAPPLLLLIVS